MISLAQSGAKSTGQFHETLPLPPAFGKAQAGPGRAGIAQCHWSGRTSSQPASAGAGAAEPTRLGQGNSKDTPDPGGEGRCVKLQGGARSILGCPEG